MSVPVFKAAPTLRAFQKSDARFRALVGPFGSGKSSVCVLELIRRAAQQAPGPDGVRRTRWAVIRNTYPELRDTTRKTFEDWVPADIGTWHEQSFTWSGKWSDGQHPVHAEVLFRSLDRPQDVKKLLSLELTGAFINEAREIPQAVFEMLQARIGRFPSRANGGCSWAGIWMDTNPWHTGHWGYRLFTRHEGVGEDKRQLFALFEQPGGRTPQAENTANLEPGYYDRLIVGKDSEWVACYVDGQYPSAAVGSVWGKQLGVLERRGGLEAFRHGNSGIFTSWDLGVSDSTAIWFWRVNPQGVLEIVDYYESAGEAASHYFAEVDRRDVDGRPYQYARHFLPHDARQRSWQTGVGIVDQFVAHYGAGAVAIGPELSLRDGIAAGRWLLEQPIRIHPRCAAGIEAVREYRYEYDEEAGAFSTRPRHDWASHGADAFRYLAVVARDVVQSTRPPDPEPGPPPVKNLRTLTMDELWECRPQRTRRV